MQGHGTGLATAVAAIGVGEPPAAGVAEQAELPLPKGPLRPARLADGTEAASAPRVPGRPGRPVGRMNKSTEAWRDYLLARYQSPLIGMAETINRRASDLALELGCDPVEAFKLQIACMRELAPFLHSKMPVAVQMAGQAPIPLVINVGGGRAGGGGVIDLELVPEKRQPEQDVATLTEAASDAQSDGEASDGA